MQAWPAAYHRVGVLGSCTAQTTRSEVTGNERARVCCFPVACRFTSSKHVWGGYERRSEAPGHWTQRALFLPTFGGPAHKRRKILSGVEVRRDSELSKSTVGYQLGTAIRSKGMDKRIPLMSTWGWRENHKKTKKKGN